MHARMSDSSTFRVEMCFSMTDVTAGCAVRLYTLETPRVNQVCHVRAHSVYTCNVAAVSS